MSGRFFVALVQDAPIQCVELKKLVCTTPTVGSRPPGIASENAMARAKQEHVNVHTGRLHACEKMVSSDCGEVVPDAHHSYA